MAITLKLGVLYLLAEFGAHTFSVLAPLKSAGAISAGFLKTLFYSLDNAFVGIIFYLHTSILSYLYVFVYKL